MQKIVVRLWQQADSFAFPPRCVANMRVCRVYHRCWRCIFSLKTMCGVSNSQIVFPSICPV
uniref:Uncharacterized protein n=1 Tax=Arundo donax TaxID=35708 RepID=A0A0A9C321_ARUDO